MMAQYDLKFISLLIKMQNVLHFTYLLIHVLGEIGASCFIAFSEQSFQHPWVTEPFSKNPWVLEPFSEIPWVLRNPF